jgi:phage gp29-like protein
MSTFRERIADAYRAVVGRPRAIESEVTVATMGQLVSWPGPFTLVSKGDRFELVTPDDLVTRFGYRIYREMLADDTVKACLGFKKVLIHGRAWEITPAGGKDASEEQKKQAQFANDVLADTHFNRIMRETLSALEYGFSAGEIIWEVSEFRDYGTKVIVKDVKHRDPEFIKIDVDKHANIVGFRQISGYMPHEIYIAPEKVIHYQINGQFGNHYGIPDLRAAYRAWWSKKFITQFWNVFLERFGSPLMMMKYPMGADQKLKDALKSILSSLSSRSDILVPEGVVVELVEATRAGTAQYADALNYCDVGISRALLVPALLGMGVDVKRGSDSQSRLHLRVLMKVAGDISADLEAIYNEKLVKPLIDMNFPGVTDFPKFTFRDYGEYEAIEIADSMINMFNAGMLDADQNDINYMRSILGAPMRKEDDEDEVNRPMPAPVGAPNDPNATGDGAQKNNNRATKGPAKAKTTRAS